MPVFVSRDPFGDLPDKPSYHSVGRKKSNTLRIPQARVLKALVPDNLTDPISEWPLVVRGMLNVRTGYTITSGTVTRAINGTRGGNGTTPPQIGLLDQRLIEEVVLDIEGLKEINYRITAAGIQAYQEYITSFGNLPEIRDPTTYTNDRYIKDKNAEV